MSYDKVIDLLLKRFSLRAGLYSMRYGLMIGLFLLAIVPPIPSQAQSYRVSREKSGFQFDHVQSAKLLLLEDRLASRGMISYDSLSPSIKDSTKQKQTYPDPKKVLYRSLMIPGWGQITNKQVWKVPIIYGLLGGLVGYSIYLNKKYHDYRAAYYNEVYSDEPGGSDYRFGPTPDYIPPGSSQSSLRYNRNYYRNQRDFMYIATGLAYGLNVVDAYIFAHMRSFDVSDDLSASAKIKPGHPNGLMGMTISLDFRAK